MPQYSFTSYDLEILEKNRMRYIKAAKQKRQRIRRKVLSEILQHAEQGDLVVEKGKVKKVRDMPDE
jgi:hypothetical protein